MSPILTILGGSTPFTAALIESLRAAGDKLPPLELRLHGRDRMSLQLMERYAVLRLKLFGWSVSTATRLDEAVDGASVVVNQIRIGNLEGRAFDEAMANQFELPADETLGPGGLSAALRVAPLLAKLAGKLGRLCPEAWLLNLANPLSITTAAMVFAGAPLKCVGLCELPHTTAIEACRVLEIPIAKAHWRYCGLNHRGFIHSIRYGDQELLQHLPDALGTRTIFGVSRQDIERTGALPLKYFPLFAAPAKAQPRSHRANFLVNLRQALARELESGQVPPPSLSKRDLRWYEAAVVPAVVAIFADSGQELILNCPREDGLVWEVPVRVFRDSYEVIANERPRHLEPRICQAAVHEHAVLEALAAPDRARIERALQLDPSVPSSRAGEIGQAIAIAQAQVSVEEVP